MDNRSKFLNSSFQRKDVLSLLFAFFGISRVFGGFLSSKYWAALFFITGFGLLLSNLKISKFKVDRMGMLLIIYLFLNVLITNPPSIFRSELRFLLFTLLLLIVSPIIQNKGLRASRLISLNLFVILSVTISFISFFCYFVGINWMADQAFDAGFYDDYSSSAGAGHFGGITNHSMTLGFISGIAVCYMLCRFLTYKGKFDFFLLIICIGTLLFSSSRAALGATMIGCFIFIVRSSKSKLGYLKTLFFICIGIVLSFPIWVGALSGILAKQEGRGDVSEMGGRLGQIEARIDEFKEHPIMGWGFASVNPQKTNVDESGNIEPGSSWLTILSMTGIVGFLIVMLLIYNSYSSLRYLNDNLPQKAFLSALIVFFITHLFVEGYIFAGGSFQCCILWLVIGVTRDMKYRRNSV